MKLSPFKLILMGVFGLAALVGLFVFATHTGRSGNSATTIGPVVIWGTLPKSDMDSFLATSTQKNQDLKDVSYVQKDPTTLPTDLASAIATGAAPDLVLASQEQLHALSRYIAPISSNTLPASTYTNVFIEEGNIYAGPSGYYGVPFLVDPLVLFSSRTIFSSVGIARPPDTWEALIGLVPTVAQLTPARQITRGLIGLGTYDNVRNARGILSTLFLQQGVPMSSYTAGAIVPNLGQAGTSGGQAPGSAVLGFYTQFADASKVSYTWNASLQSSDQKFLDGSVALYLGYASEAHFFAKANPNLDFIVSPVPEPATATAKGTYGLLYAFMIPNGGRNPSGAYQAAVLFSQADAQAAAAVATGLAPATLTALSTRPSDPVAVVAYAEALYAKGWLSPMPVDTDRVFSGMIMDVVSGRSTVATALTSAERSLGSLLK